MLRQVISGGQTGVDQAALEAAWLLGIPTGGKMPKGFRTTAGGRPDMRDKYGMREDEVYDYPPRTYANVLASHGTLRIASNFYSAGEGLTLRAVTGSSRPYLDVHIKSPKPPKLVYDWLVKHDIQILNVAGNSEETSPGIYEEALAYLLQVFSLDVMGV